MVKLIFEITCTQFYTVFCEHKISKYVFNTKYKLTKQIKLLCFFSFKNTFLFKHLMYWNEFINAGTERLLENIKRQYSIILKNTCNLTQDSQIKKKQYLIQNQFLSLI